MDLGRPLVWVKPGQAKYRTIAFTVRQHQPLLWVFTVDLFILGIAERIRFDIPEA